MSIDHRVSVRNENHSYPPYPVITTLHVRGSLTLDDNGMIFRPERRSLTPIVIHWRNLISTYPSVQEIPGLLPGHGLMVSIMSLGLVEGYIGVVSVKFKEPTYDKVCVLEFSSAETIIPNRHTALDWATKLDTEIWDCKRHMREEWN